jgi:hypothetical protein
MRTAPIGLAVAILLFTCSGVANLHSARELALSAVSADRAAASAAIVELRAMGQKGVDTMLEAHSAEIARFKETGKPSDEWGRIAAAMDAVAMQKDVYASGLFWYTDLDEAKAAAKASGRQILSLRLLGNLNEEFSCANSRLFRAILYADPRIASYLKDNYILHWRSVRPAPRITVDFGDGRKIERTITGNSIHYVLDADGAIIDALPGLYSPKAFLENLAQAAELARRVADEAPGQKDLSLKRWRAVRFDAIRESREFLMKASDITLSDPETGTQAIRALPMAVTKMVVTGEDTLLRRFDDMARFEGSIRFDGWRALAAGYARDVELSREAVQFIRRQNLATGRTEAEFEQMLSGLRDFISLDTTRNDFLFRLQLLSRLNRDEGRVGLEAFNSRVYTELFRTPDSDPWLGLYSSDVYAALDGNGIVLR